jgi:hypothetical protein
LGGCALGPGFAYFLFFIAGGLTVARYWLPGSGRLLAGTSVRPSAILFLLWLPVLWAYAVAFTMTAHLLAALTLFLTCCSPTSPATGGARALRGRGQADAARGDRGGVPLKILAECWNTRIPSASRRTAPTTWGRAPTATLSLHLAIATSAINAPSRYRTASWFGATMAYPYLSDTFASTFCLLGMGLPRRMTLTGTLMCASSLYRYALLCAQLARAARRVWLAVCLLFLNGGLGFFYNAERHVENGRSPPCGTTLRTVIDRLLQNAHQPPDPNNLRWVNILCDMLVPQRAPGRVDDAMPALLSSSCRRSRAAGGPPPRAMAPGGIIAGGMPCCTRTAFWRWPSPAWAFVPTRCLRLRAGGGAMRSGPSCSTAAWPRRCRCRS